MSWLQKFKPKCARLVRLGLTHASLLLRLLVVMSSLIIGGALVWYVAQHESQCESGSAEEIEELAPQTSPYSHAPAPTSPPIGGPWAVLSTWCEGSAPTTLDIAATNSEIHLDRYGPNCRVKVQLHRQPQRSPVLISGRDARLRALELVVPQSDVLSVLQIDLRASDIHHLNIHPIGEDGAEEAHRSNYPHACRDEDWSQQTQPALAAVGSIDLSEATTRVTSIRHIHAGALDAPRHRTVMLQLTTSRFSGSVNLQAVRADVIQADRAIFEGGIRLFGAHIQEHADFASAEFHVEANFMLANVAEVLQLSQAHFVSSTPGPSDSDVPRHGGWVLDSIHASEVKLQRVTFEGPERLQLTHATITDGVDLRDTPLEQVEVAGSDFGGLLLSTNPGHSRLCRDSRERGHSCGGTNVSNVDFGAYCGSTESGGERELVRAFGSDSEGLRIISKIFETRGDLEANYKFTLRSEWAAATAGESVFLAITGHGRRPMWWYFGSFVCVYLLSVAVFWKKPGRWRALQANCELRSTAATHARWHNWLGLAVAVAVAVVAAFCAWLLWRVRPATAPQAQWFLVSLGLGFALFAFSCRQAKWASAWRRYRWLYALGVLLPAFFDIGVSLKKDDDYFWKDDPHAQAMTFAFHALHIIGWFVLSLLAYAVSKRFT